VTLVDWIPALTTSALLGIAVYLFKNVFENRLKNTIKHEFDLKLDKSRAEIAENKSQLEALRDGALEGVVNRQLVLHQKRVESVEKLWSGVQQMAPAKGLALSMATLQYENVVADAVSDVRVRDFVGKISGDFDGQCLSTPDAIQSRLFASDLAWALYAAYQSVLQQYYMMNTLVKTGLGNVDVVAFDKIAEVLKKALPHQAENIDNFGYTKYYMFLEELESRLLTELRAMLQSSDANSQAVAEAAEILSSVDALSKHQSEAQ